MLEIAPGIYIQAANVTFVKEIDEDSCLLFMTGQDALSGSVVERNARELAEDISNFLGEDLTSVFSGEAQENEDEEE